MSYFKASRRRYISFLTAIGFSVLVVTACGFTPVHRSGAGQSARANLALVSVAAIAGRSGLLLRNRLLEKLSPRGVADVPRYQLSVQLTSSTEDLLIQLDNSPTRNNLKMNASFELTDISSDVTVYRGGAISVGSYNVVDSQFATIAAKKNAADRAAREIAEDIYDLVIIYFNGVKS